MVRFRVETIPLGAGIDIAGERLFLNSVIQYFRKVRADVIIPPTNNAVFRTYPDNAQAAPYGTYAIDLAQPADVLWRNIAKTSRHNISAAERDGVSIREGIELLDPAYDLIRETFGRCNMSFMNRTAFRRFAQSLGNNARILMAEYQGIPQSYSLFAFSEACAYWIYGGNILGQHQGATKLLQWEAIRSFRNIGVRKYDFFGARIDPPKNSKQEGINLMKKHLGGTLQKGYIWKYSLRPWQSRLYSMGVRILRGGDIVDREGHKLHAREGGPEK
jgi:lipid II:glycine glycyltransferase (peptidoglycan interpeptide bridge formation enzyme)